MTAPCGCKKAKAIRQRAERQQRQMTDTEVVVALAADLDMTPEELLRHLPALPNQ